MGENVDVKTLMARFHAQGVLGVGGSPRPQLPMFERAGPAAIRPRSPASGPVPAPRPFPGANSDLPRFALPPRGVFPRPPPGKRLAPQETPRPPPPDVAKPVKTKLCGDLRPTKVIKLPGTPTSKSPCPLPSLLPSQKVQAAEVVPLMRPLPQVGQRPAKPKRPPAVNLEHFRHGRTAARGHLGSPSKSAAPPQPSPPLLPHKPASLITRLSIHDPEDTYDDIDQLPPPPPPPPKSQEMSPLNSWTGCPGQTEEFDSDQSEIYEGIDEDPNPTLPTRKTDKDIKRQQEQEKKVQKVLQKKENEYRKRFKLCGPVTVLHTAKVHEDWQGGKNDLSVRQGESVEIIRVENNPEGKWLARTPAGVYGYISNTCVDVDYGDLKRKLRVSAIGPALATHIPQTNLEFDASDHGESMEDDVYDDVDDLPLPPPEISQDPKRTKKLEKEEKEFRKKFKFEGPIRALGAVMVDPNANIKKGGGKDLSVVRGEILDVIQLTSEKKALCRNEQGKYGYVPRAYLLQEEGDIYDDVDHMEDVYDNDSPAY
ncbi:FYN-binding protein 1 [Denticeps clupeoides]|uniref:SH3 domain-containing protein n=1 Tax=Denticeps clupeoides TaxID=299321 RepID=A0AAY4CFL8_9TELE|nr:FYN-binding protein 1-like [Denticeps clupeoides]